MQKRWREGGILTITGLYISKDPDICRVKFSDDPGGKRVLDARMHYVGDGSTQWHCHSEVRGEHAPPSWPCHSAKMKSWRPPKFL